MCIDCGCAPTDHHHKHDHGTGKKISIEEDLLSKNNRLAMGNRRLFQDKGLLVLNLVWVRFPKPDSHTCAEHGPMTYPNLVLFDNRRLSVDISFSGHNGYKR